MRRFVGFVGRKTAAALLTLLTVIAIGFLIYRAIPSEPARFVYPVPKLGLTPAQDKHGREVLGLERPMVVQYVSYLSHAIRGDLGHSWEGARLISKNEVFPGPSVSQQIFPRLRITLSIVLGGAALVLLLAMPLGALAGRRIGSWTDRVISFVALLGICTHPMVLGLILGSAAGRLQWLPTQGYCPLIKGPHDPCGGIGAWSSHLALPWVTFAFLFLALYTRMVRASIDETLHEDFVRTARAKGASELRVLARHVVPSAALRVLVMVGMEIGTAIGVSIYIESAFKIDGLGRLAVIVMGGNADSLDLPMLLGIVTIVTLLVVVGNLLVDLLHAALDPRGSQAGAEKQSKSLVGGVF